MFASCAYLTQATAGPVPSSRCASNRLVSSSTSNFSPRPRRKHSSRIKFRCEKFFKSFDVHRTRLCTYNGSISVSATAKNSPQPLPEHGKGPVVLNLPTMLTLLRVAAVPCITILFYMQGAWVAPACSAIFILAAITDWADGYLARKLELVSSFGAFLDPVADKLMVATALVLMCTRPPPDVNAALISIPATIIIGREITMSAIREWAAAASGKARAAVAVNSYGKIKTAAQLVALSVLLGARDGCGWIRMTGASEIWLINSGLLCLWLSAGLASISLWIYLVGVMKFMS